MKAFTYATIFTLAAAVTASANDVTYYFVDDDQDEVFDVLVGIEGATTGLATYNVALSGLDASPLDPNSFGWSENVLGNFNDVTFLPQGIPAGSLLEGAIGTDGYSATNTQFNGNEILGIGITPLDIPGNMNIPANQPILLEVPALLGQLTLPGANGLSDEELGALLSPNAALFVDGEDSGVVVVPDSITSMVVRIPEPASALLAGLALVGFAARRK